MQGIQGSLYEGQTGAEVGPCSTHADRNGVALAVLKPAPSSCGSAAAEPHDDGHNDAGASRAAGVLTPVPQTSTLARLAQRYLKEEVYGIQADATFAAKARDLGGFLTWLTRSYGGDDAAWVKHDTVEYMKTLERDGRAPATINRALGTLKSFALWVMEQPEDVFRLHGLPTRGVAMRPVPPPSCKKLSGTAVRRLVRAAFMLTKTRDHANQRPWRDRAMLMVLLHTGLRAHELVGLKLYQYTGKALVRVRRKGRNETPLVYVPVACREAVDDYIARERAADAGPCGGEAQSAPLFLAGGRAMLRQHVNEILATIAREANKNDPDNLIHVSPHMLRHTFGAKHREASGSDGETAAALGHVGLAHVARYTRKSDDERAAVIEGLF